MPYATLLAAGTSGNAGRLPGCASGGRLRFGGPLAQLAEQVTLNHPVLGSTPGRLTKDNLTAATFDREGEVSELADEHDLGSCAARRGSSSLLFPTTQPMSSPVGPTGGPPHRIASS